MGEKKCMKDISYSIGIFLSLVVMAFGIEVTLLANYHGGSRVDIATSFLNKAQTININDGIDPLHRQAQPETCGAAAAAYVLTQLGDLVFEEHFLNKFGKAPDGGFTFVDLQAFFRWRGFDSNAYFGSVEDLPEKGATPVIAHLSHGHYVVVHSSDEDYVILFDPAIGKTVAVDTLSFLEKWSGKFMKVTTLPYGHFADRSEKPNNSVAAPAELY